MDLTIGQWLAANRLIVLAAAGLFLLGVIAGALIF